MRPSVGVPPLSSCSSSFLSVFTEVQATYHLLGEAGWTRLSCCLSGLGGGYDAVVFGSDCHLHFPHQDIRARKAVTQLLRRGNAGSEPWLVPGSSCSLDSRMDPLGHYRRVLDLVRLRPRGPLTQLRKASCLLLKGQSTQRHHSPRTKLHPLNKQSHPGL